MMMKKCLRDLPMLSQMLTHTVTAHTFLVIPVMRTMMVINKFVTMMMFMMIMVLLIILMVVCSQMYDVYVFCQT